MFSTKLHDWITLISTRRTVLRMIEIEGSLVTLATDDAKQLL